MRNLLNLPESSLSAVVGYVLSPRALGDSVRLGLVCKLFHTVLLKEIGDYLNILIIHHNLFVRVHPTLESYYRLISKRVYIVGGSESGQTCTCFNPEKGTFETLPPLYGSRKAGLSVVSHRGLLFAFGGEEISHSIEVFDVFNPNSFWKKVVDFPFDCNGAVGVSAGFDLYIFGSRIKAGYDINTVSTIYKLECKENHAVEGVYDLNFDLNRCPAQLLIPRSHCGATYYNNMIWLAGGKVGGELTSSNTVEIFDPHTQQCSEGPQMLRHRLNPHLVVIESTLYAVGGDIEEPFLHGVQSIEKYDAQKEAWVFVSFFLDPRKRIHCAVAAYDSKIFLFGGAYGTSIWHSWDFYDVHKHYWASQLQHNLQDAEKVVRSFQSHHLLTDGDIHYLRNIQLISFGERQEDIVHAQAVTYFLSPV
ncbi:hypothetical protein EON65_13760 [archaeon]|nr:MAG: hypothetical protein EON65_13760 [archaeon]